MTARVWQIIGVGILAVATAGLSVLALQHVSPHDTAAVTTAASHATPTPRVTATATKTATSAPVPTIAPSDQRFLAAYGTDVWRATAGHCGADGATGAVAPTLQHSADGGTTWTTVTPKQPAVTQIVALDAITIARAAEAVATTNPACTPTLVRTFVGGIDWESAPTLLGGKRYIDPTQPAQVVTPNGTLAAPCEGPHGLRGRGDTLALVCDGKAWLHTAAGGDWAALPGSGALAVATTADGVTVASTHVDGCRGIGLTHYTGATAPGTPAGCAAGADTSGPVAIVPTATGTLVWAGDVVTDVSAE